MNNWLAVEHREAGVIVLHRAQFDFVDPELDQMNEIGTFDCFSQALKWVEESRGILTGYTHHRSQVTCSWGPGAPAFGIVRESRFGSVCGVFVRDRSLPGALRDAFVAEWHFTKTAAIDNLNRIA